MYYLVVLFAFTFYILAIKEYKTLIKYFYDNCKAKKINSILLVIQKGLTNFLMGAIHRIFKNDNNFQLIALGFV
jgi:hypothetical protein